MFFCYLFWCLLLQMTIWILGEKKPNVFKALKLKTNLRDWTFHPVTRPPSCWIAL